MREFVIDVHRKWKRDTYTISKFVVDGGVFTCDCIEDKDRGLHDGMTPEEISRKKVYGETAIPAGRYKLVMSYSNRMGGKAAYAWCKGILPEIRGVKGYSGIRIHSGNTAKDSLGCLLVGKNAKVGMVTESMSTLKQIIPLINKAIQDGRACYINIH